MLTAIFIVLCLIFFEIVSKNWREERDKNIDEFVKKHAYRKPFFTTDMPDYKERREAWLRETKGRD